MELKKIILAALWLLCVSALQKDFDLNNTVNGTKKSRKKMEALFQPKVKLGPDANEPTPTVLFHGVKQRCSEFMI
jgi:hypothetical protein